MNKSRALHNGRLHGRLAGIAGLPQAIVQHRSDGTFALAPRSWPVHLRLRREHGLQVLAAKCMERPYQ